MLVRLLGPVDVIADGQPRPVRGLRRKAILATLALHEGEIVSTGRLVDIVWGKTVSPASVNTLQSHLSYLRSMLGSRTAIVSRPPGYVLDLASANTDVRRAELLLRDGTRTADPAEGARNLTDALALWRGTPLADVTGLAWLEEQAERLDLLRLQVQRALFAARLAAGEHAQILPGLERLAAGQPLDEQLHGQLMLALYRSGRQADALAVYRRMRHTLGQDLGIDPSEPLRELETAILRQDPSLDTPRPTVTVLAAPAPVPAQLPLAVSGFAGRHAELASLDALLAAVAQAGAVVIAAISGTAGVGKTALAVHWAHRVAAQFPDGQLYVNLRGFDPGGPPVDPAEAARGFLDALGVPAERIPAGLAARTALYRSMLAGKRVLVVLDNVRDAAQVRPLLPGSPGCLAIVTSRNQLAGLVAADGASPLSLDLLTAAEATDLLVRRLGAARVAGDPAAVEVIVERCARLPLALTVAAARAATRRSFPLADIAAELHSATRALDPFGGRDAATDARAVFSWSYQVLGPDAARLFRLLGLHPGPDIAVAAAASLAAIPQDQAHELLADLADAHLLSELRPGRYAFHDLLRAHASELARSEDSRDARDAAVRRLLDHYLHTSGNAAALMEPYLSLPVLAGPQPGVVVGELITAETAAGWFAAEHATLLAAVDLAANAGLGTPSWPLAWTMTSFLLRRGMWALNNVGYSHAQLGRYEQALADCQQSLAMVQRTGARGWEAVVWCSLGYIHCQLGDPQQAIACHQRSVGLCRERAERYNEAAALDRLGDVHECAGDTAAARRAWAQALRLFDEIDHPDGGGLLAKLRPCPVNGSSARGRYSMTAPGAA